MLMFFWLHMKVNNFFQYFLINILYFGVFFIIHIIHFQFFAIKIVLDACLFDIFISLLIIFIVTYFLKINFFIIFASTNSSILIVAIYAILIPTMVDRSISVDIVAKIAEHKQFSRKELIDSIDLDCVFKKRFEEQISKGLIKEDMEKNLIITQKGKIVSSIFMWNKKILNMKNNNNGLCR